MGNIEEEFTNKLLGGAALKSEMKVRSRNFIYETVDKRMAEDYEGKGWIKDRENKKTFVFKKPKSHDIVFEDKVWTMFAKMDFKVLNKRELKLPYTDDETIPGKQIDVFAADDETIIVVECKSAQEMKNAYFSKELNEYDKVITGGNKILKKKFSDKHKIRYVFATNNIILSANDRKRLRELHMNHFNQDDISYYEELLARVGQASRYQLLAKLFEDQEIPALNNKIPAVRGQMGGYHYYSFSVEPERLLKISYILHRVNVTNSTGGYQRLVTKGRLKEIQNFINGGGYFPNSVILNFNTKKEHPLNYDKVASVHDSDTTEPVILHLPKRYHSAFIIDGQHRLYGYSNTKYKSTNSIPVVAFENLPAAEQIELFVQINSNQRPVSRNLIRTILSDIMWNSDKYDSALEGFMARLLVNLGKREDSPLYRCIMLGDKKKTPTCCITLDTIINYGFKKTLLFAKLSNKRLEKTGYLWCDPKKEDGFDYQEMLDKSYLFFKNYFDHIKENTISIWTLGSAPGGFIAMNIGILCFIRIAGDLLDFICTYEGEDYSKKDGEEIAKLTFRYLEPVLNYINGFEIVKIDQFRKYGTNPTGVENGVREYQRAINGVFKEFSPAGLLKWIDDNSGKYNDVADIAAKVLEDGIKSKVFEVLKDNFGEAWWDNGVQEDIRISASVARIKAQSKDPDYDFLHLIEYKKIIERNWVLFKGIFADPAIKRSNKDEQLKWYDSLNSIRNTVFHRRKVSVADHAILVQINEWLPERIGIGKFNIAV